MGVTLERVISKVHGDWEGVQIRGGLEDKNPQSMSRLAMIPRPMLRVSKISRMCVFRWKRIGAQEWLNGMDTTSFRFFAMIDEGKHGQPAVFEER